MELLGTNVEKMKASKDVKGLLKVLKESDDIGVAFSVEEALEDIGHRTVEPFLEALKDKDAYVRSGAAWIIGNIKDASTMEPLIEALKDEDKDVRWLAVVALGDIGDERAISPITMIPTVNDEFLKEIVSEALEKIKNRCMREML